MTCSSFERKKKSFFRTKYQRQNGNCLRFHNRKKITQVYVYSLFKVWIIYQRVGAFLYIKLRYANSAHLWALLFLCSTFWNYLDRCWVVNKARSIFTCLSVCLHVCFYLYVSNYLSTCLPSILTFTFFSFFLFFIFLLFVVSYSSSISFFFLSLFLIFSHVLFFSCSCICMCVCVCLCAYLILLS